MFRILQVVEQWGACSHRKLVRRTNVRADFSYYGPTERASPDERCSGPVKSWSCSERPFSLCPSTSSTNYSLPSQARPPAAIPQCQKHIETQAQCSSTACAQHYSTRILSSWLPRPCSYIATFKHSPAKPHRRRLWIAPTTSVNARTDRSAILRSCACACS